MINFELQCSPGANIIQENMRLGEELQVSSDTAGKVVHAIYGFCDIRNFTDCTEVRNKDSFLIQFLSSAIKIGT